MSTVTEALAGGHGKQFRVDIKMDYYGSMRAEVRSGFIVKSVSRPGISPRHLTTLSHRLSQKSESLCRA